jgi:hypothetical protein
MLATAAPAAVVAPAPACAPSAIQVSLARGGAAAGTAYVHVVFHNSSRAACGLTGFPGVSVDSASGRQVGAPAARTPVPYRRVVIPAHASAHALLGIVDWANFPRSFCRPVHVARLRIYPPNWTASRLVPYPYVACSARSIPYDQHAMSIGPVVRGA